MKLKLNLPGFQELRNSPELLRDLEDRAERIQAAAMDGYTKGKGELSPPYEVSPAQTGDASARTGVYTKSAHAMNHNAAHNTLLRALEAGRG